MERLDACGRTVCDKVASEFSTTRSTTVYTAIHMSLRRWVYIVAQCEPHGPGSGMQW